MKQRVLILLKGFVAWTLFFLVARGLFLIYQSNLTTELSLSDILLTFVHGVRMDMSMAGYFSLLPGLLLAFTFFAPGRRIWPIWYAYHVIIVFLSCLIIVIDLELYVHWGFRLDATPLMYFGKEAAGSGDFWRSVLLLLYCILIFSITSFLFYRYFKKRVAAIPPGSWTSLPLMIFATALLIMPIRGSFGVAPMNTGFVYFHPTNLFANHAAVNVVWNFGYAVRKINALKYPDNYFDREKTEKYTEQLFPASGKTTRLINTDRPNVIIIILESYTSSFIKALGGLPDVAPRFNALVKEGILFDNFYSSGDRTDKGIVAVLNGYPSQPLTSIIKVPKKTKSLPYLNKAFKAEGYRTEFTYGYNINYANFNSYLMHGEFDHVTHSMDFPQELNTSKWGVHDHYVFGKFFEEAQQCPQPFFKIMMTQSSHEPFDVPMETVFEGEEPAPFLNSAYYTDKSLGEFLDKARQQEWWKNTLVVITADHGHPLPDNQGVNNYRKFRIPMLWIGGALAVRDTIIHTIAGQTDIAKTILAQLNLPNEQFTFSNDILSDTYKPFSVYVFNNGFGMVKEGKLVVYDNFANAYVRQEGQLSTTDMEEGKAYMQKLYWDFNSR